MELVDQRAYFGILVILAAQLQHVLMRHDFRVVAKKHCRIEFSSETTNLFSPQEN